MLSRVIFTVGVSNRRRNSISDERLTRKDNWNRRIVCVICQCVSVSICQSVSVYRCLSVNQYLHLHNTVTGERLVVIEQSVTKAVVVVVVVVVVAEDGDGSLF